MDAFEELEVWRRSSRLCVDIHRMTEGVRDRSFRDQLFHSALSAPSNIAEGYERGSRREFVRFLRIAKGSCAEMRTQLYIGIGIGMLERDATSRKIDETVEISRTLQGLIRRLTTEA